MKKPINKKGLEYAKELAKELKKNGCTDICYSDGIEARGILVNGKEVVSDKKASYIDTLIRILQTLNILNLNSIDYSADIPCIEIDFEGIHIKYELWV